MRNDAMHAAMATWAAKDLPGRLSVAETAKVLGFAEHDIQILMGAGKLRPLGDPAPNAPKWFAAIEIIQRATDQDWLGKATKEVSKYWRHRRERQSGSSGFESPSRRRSERNTAEKVSPNSSPKSSPAERLMSIDGAMTGDERIVREAA
jgi:hypothetical protein